MPAATCAISVTFSPTAVGAAPATLTIVDNAGTQTVALSGTGTGQVNAFGEFVEPRDDGSGQYQRGQNGDAHQQRESRDHLQQRRGNRTVCASPAIRAQAAWRRERLAPSASRSRRLPPESATGTLTITDSALNSPQTVALTGTGTAAGGSVTVSPSSLTFPQQPTGTTSAGMAVTVTNTGSAAVTNNGVTITGDFAETTTCTSSIAAGKSCTITVTFSPTVSGTRTGTLTINLSSGVQTVSLSGTSAVNNSPGALSLSASTLTFSGYTIGDNPSKSVTVSNTGGAAVGIGSVAIAGDPSFTEKTTCGTSLAAGATCTITVTFKPTAYGTFTSTVTLTEASGAQHPMAVTGTSSVDN